MATLRGDISFRYLKQFFLVFIKFDIKICVLIIMSLFIFIKFDIKMYVLIMSWGRVLESVLGLRHVIRPS